RTARNRGAFHEPDHVRAGRVVAPQDVRLAVPIEIACDANRAGALRDSGGQRRALAGGVEGGDGEAVGGGGRETRVAVGERAGGGERRAVAEHRVARHADVVGRGTPGQVDLSGGNCRRGEPGGDRRRGGVGGGLSGRARRGRLGGSVPRGVKGLDSVGVGGGR